MALVVAVLLFLCALPWLCVRFGSALFVELATVVGVGLIAAICIGLRFAEVATCAGDEEWIGEAIGYWTVFVMPVSTVIAFVIGGSGLVALKRLKR